jgi:hypothetical protein
VTDDRPDPRLDVAGEPGEPAGASGPAPGRGPRRPVVERLGMAAVAAVLAILFGGVAAASLAGGELFLGVMAAIGALMTAWVGLLTLVRG